METAEQRKERMIRQGQRLRELRQAAGLSQRELAEKINTAQVTVSTAERGARPLPATSLLLAAGVLGVDPTEIGQPENGVEMPAMGGRKRTAEETLRAQDYGARIRKRRHELELSQQELSELLGVHHNMLGEWERGRALPSPRYRDALAAAVGVRYETREAGPAGEAVAACIRSQEEKKAAAAAEKTDSFRTARVNKLRQHCEARLAAITAPRQPDEEEQKTFELALAAARKKDAAAAAAPEISEKARAARQANIEKARNSQREAALRRYGRLDARHMTEEERNAFNGYAARLRNARQAAGLSVKEASERIGMTGNLWSTWECRGTIPSAQARQKIENLLGLQDPPMPQPEPEPEPTAPGEYRVTVIQTPTREPKRPGRKPEQASTLLDYTCILAREAGMHYGAYVAMAGDEAIRKGWEKVLRKRKKKPAGPAEGETANV